MVILVVDKCLYCLPISVEALTKSIVVECEQGKDAAPQAPQAGTLGATPQNGTFGVPAATPALQVAGPWRQRQQQSPSFAKSS